MAQCSKCEYFKPDYQLGKCSVFHAKVHSHWQDCEKYESKTYKGDFDDELDEYLFENHQVKSGCCSSVENLKYQIAREVAEKMIEEFNISIQYVSQEERRKKMDEMYGVNKLPLK
jgi:hypothetical protein